MSIAMQIQHPSDKRKAGKGLQMETLRQRAENRLQKTAQAMIDATAPHNATNHTATNHSATNHQTIPSAETALGANNEGNTATFAEKERLLQALQVHQIELEIQNEELRRVQGALEQSLDRYVSLYEFAPVGYLTLNAAGVIMEANRTSALLLDEASAHLHNKHFAGFVAPEDAARWLASFSQVKRQGNCQQCDLKMQRADGSVFFAHLCCLALGVPEIKNVKRTKKAAPKTANAAFNHEAPLVRVTLTDVTDIKMTEQELRVAATVFECQEGMMITDAHSNILRVNRAFSDITGYTADDVVGITPKKLRSGRHDEAFYEDMWQRIRTTGVWQGEVWNRKKNDEIFPAWLTITAVKNNCDEITHYVATIVDISARKAMDEEMHLLAFYDPLTKLPNRRLMIDRLRCAIPSCARSKRHGALMFIDLDKFKEINDQLGHDIGDMLLQLVAQRLSICVREGDTVARMGGDEFMVMLENLSESPHEAEVTAKAIGNKILNALHQTFRLGGHVVEGSASIGITLFVDHQYSISELQKQADLAMYEAKVHGRNQLCFFRDGIHLLSSNDQHVDR